MTGEDYKRALAALGLDHDSVAIKIGMTSRTSYRYAKEGAPKRIAMLLESLMETQRSAVQRKRRKAA